MNKDHSAFFGMVGRVVGLFEEYPGAWKNIPVVVSTYNELKAQSETGLKLLNSKEGIKTEGYTTAKDVKFGEMTKAAFILSKRLSSYARDNENWVLLSQVQYSESGITKGSETEVMNRCMVIANQADKVVGAADDYKVTQEVIANLRKLIGEYKDMPTQRDNVRSAKKVTGQDLIDDISTIRATLDKLEDKVLGLIDDKNFNDLFKEAKMINNHGSRSRDKKDDNTDNTAQK
jgi:hypothetical protein